MLVQVRLTMPVVVQIRIWSLLAPYVVYSWFKPSRYVALSTEPVGVGLPGWQEGDSDHVQRSVSRELHVVPRHMYLCAIHRVTARFFYAHEVSVFGDEQAQDTRTLSIL